MRRALLLHDLLRVRSVGVQTMVYTMAGGEAVGGMRNPALEFTKKVK